MTDDTALWRLLRAIASAPDAEVFAQLTASPGLAHVALSVGKGVDQILSDIRHYAYGGDTALHIAAAAHRPAIVRGLIDLGADVAARNRRGAQPLHYAADGVPGWSGWNPNAQAQTVVCLITAGADPNALDKGGVTPLHRAVRTRCAAAVEALLRGGADPVRKNKNGSTPMMLATQTTGRGGSGSPDAKAQQGEIVLLLERFTATA